MFPFIRDGDVVTVTPRTVSSPSFGSVVAFTNGPDEKLTLHRVIRMTPGHYVTKGDSAMRADGFISEGSIVGVVTAVEKRLGKKRYGLGAERVLIGILSRLGLTHLVLRIRLQIAALFSCSEQG